jgi:lysozyme
MDKSLLQADLVEDEGLRLFVYDDANGQPVRPGYKLIGHPSIGVGRCLDLHGISKPEAMFLCNNSIDEIAAVLPLKIAFWEKLSEPQQRVLANIAYNSGVEGLLGFHDMLGALAAGNAPAAGDEVVRSTLARPRALRLRSRLMQA